MRIRYLKEWTLFIKEIEIKMSRSLYVIVILFCVMNIDAYGSIFIPKLIQRDTIPNAEISTLKETNRNLNELISGLRDQIKSKDDIIENLKKDTSNYGLKVKNIEIANKTTLAKLESKENEFFKYKEETDKSKCKVDLENYIKNNKIIRTENDELKLERLTTKSELDNYKKSLSQFEQMKKQLEQAEKDIKVLNENTKSKDEKIKQLESESKEIKSKLQNYEGIENLLVDDLEKKVKEITSGQIRKSDDIQVKSLEQECEKLLEAIGHNQRIPLLKQELFSFINECAFIDHAKNVLSRPVAKDDVQNNINQLSQLTSSNINIKKERDALIPYLKTYCKVYQEVYTTLTDLDILNQKQSRLEDVEFAKRKINP